MVHWRANRLAAREISSLASLSSGTNGAGARPWSARTWLLLPALALAVMVFFAPHSLDVAISKPFFNGSSWPWYGVDLFSTVFHKGLKAVPIVIALGAIGFLVEAVFARRKGRAPYAARWFSNPEKRLLYLLAGMAASVLLVWWLKGTTGVSCPWNAKPFGGNRIIVDPSFSLFFRSGNCWPAGHAGTGFCLFSLYFMLRDEHPRAARFGFAFAMLMGILCGTTRLMQGAHFASHNIATMLIDWLVCAGIYAQMFARGTINKNIRAAFTSPMGLPAAIVLTALWWTFVFDIPLAKQLLERAGSDQLLFLFGTLAAFFFVGAALLTLMSALPKPLFRLMAALFALCGATGFTGAMLYGVIFTPDMVRNFIATDVREASQYLGVRTTAIFLFAAVPPLWAAWLAGRGAKGECAAGTRLARLGKSLKTGAKRTIGALVFLAMGVGIIFLNFQTFAGVMREDKTLRYQIAPVNVIYSGIRTLATDASPDAKRVRAVVDPTPVLATKPEKPTLFVIFVGETTRAANWQLAGYERATNPKLSQVNDLISFPRVAACGTSTDVSLPCMMNRIGRSDYDRERILAEEALPDVLKRAGAEVLWIDNQSGCKGVCAGVPSRRPTADDKNCPDGVCYDAVFTSEIARAAADLKPGSTTVLFLHMYGSHGPAYFKGSPDERKVFRPECTAADLSSCPVEDIRNAYDNSVIETDSVLADAIGVLRKAAEEKGVNTGMLWVSDHGESLGEKGLFLHGAPYMMAPDEQLQVPMVMWFSDAFAETYGVDRAALAERAKKDATHEHLYSTVLGLLNVESKTYRKAFDLTEGD